MKLKSKAKRGQAKRKKHNKRTIKILMGFKCIAHNWTMGRTCISRVCCDFFFLVSKIRRNCARDSSPHEEDKNAWSEAAWRLQICTFFDESNEFNWFTYFTVMQSIAWQKFNVDFNIALLFTSFTSHCRAERSSAPTDATRHFCVR